MAKFLHGNFLNSATENIFRDATSQLFIISPFIKLHERYKSALHAHLKNDKVEIIIVFGKNEDNLSKSMSADDINFFKEFPNVEIRYEKRLHAKYYANESTAIISSMNLYSYSQDNNIETGILIEHSRLGNNVLDDDAIKYFFEVIERADLIFKKIPIYETTLLGLKKTYLKSNIETDRTSEIFSSYTEKSDTVKNIGGQHKDAGYCIRTGVKIPFNIEKPLSSEAYKSWSRYNDPNYVEKFCHFSGEHSNGETSVGKPILKKNWKKAQEVFKF